MPTEPTRQELKMVAPRHTREKSTGIPRERASTTFRLIDAKFKFGSNESAHATLGAEVVCCPSNGGMEGIGGILHKHTADGIGWHTRSLWDGYRLDR